MSGSPSRSPSGHKSKSGHDDKDSHKKKAHEDRPKRSGSGASGKASEPVFVPEKVVEGEAAPTPKPEPPKPDVVSKSPKTEAKASKDGTPRSPKGERKDDRLRTVSLTQQKAAEEKARQLTNQLSEQQQKELKEAFSIFDKNGDGGISNDELKIFLETLGQKPTDKEVSALMKEVDADGNGEIDFDEFLQMMIRQLNPEDKEDEIARVFAVFDPEKKGYIKEADLVAAFTSMGDLMSLKDVEEIIKAADKTADGHIDFKSLIKLLVS